MEGWIIVVNPKPGDVASSGGHVAIVTEEGYTVGTDSTVKPPGVIARKDWGFRKGQTPTFRRYVGDENKKTDCKYK